MQLLALALVIFVVGCGSGGDASPDGGRAVDASIDGGPAELDAQAPADASIDASSDAPFVPLDAATTPSASTTVACGAGPFPTDDRAPEPCDPDPDPMCPTQPPESAIPIARVATCAYGRGGTSCEPIVGGSCPDADGIFYDFNLVNPNPGAPPGCWGRAHLLVEPNAAGGMTVEYGGYATRNGDCADLGMVEGSLDVEAMCCEQIIDLHFPHGGFTFRMAVRVDWM